MPDFQFLGRHPLGPFQRRTLAYVRGLLHRNIETATIVRHLVRLGIPLPEAERAVAAPPAHRPGTFVGEGSAPDLVEALAHRGAPMPLLEDLCAFGAAIHSFGMPMDMDRCAMDESGEVQIAYHRPLSGIEARPGDAFHGGVAFHASVGTGATEVVPRILRQACTNGMILVTDEITRGGSYRRDAAGHVHGVLADAVHLGFSRRVLREATVRMHDLARQPATDPLQVMASRGLALPPATHARVRHAFAQEQEATAYAVLNAVTRTARDAGTVAERVELERLAGHLCLRFAESGARIPTADLAVP